MEGNWIKTGKNSEISWWKIIKEGIKKAAILARRSKKLSKSVKKGEKSPKTHPRPPPKTWVTPVPTQKSSIFGRDFPLAIKQITLWPLTNLCVSYEIAL